MIHRRVKARLVSPIALIHELGLPGSGPFIFLDSAGGGPHLCRFSFLGWHPRLRITMKDGLASINSANISEQIRTRDPFDLLREALSAMKPSVISEAAYLSKSQDALTGSAANLTFTGGAMGMVSYDAGRYIEKLPSLADDDLGFPDLDFIFPQRLICFDHATGEAHMFFENTSASELIKTENCLKYQEKEVGATIAVPNLERHAFNLSSVTRSNMSTESFQHIVRRAKEYIQAGDIFQSNLSQRLELDFQGDSLDLYQALRLVNPSPFSGYLDMSGYEIISSSPERLIRLRGRVAETRPIAGTRRRGADFREDDSLRQELNLDAKERAEHIMLVDLERNDLGRVCDYGSVLVDELMVNEAYSHVIHIVSNVQGILHRKKDALDLLKAVFPGGTITGCPKVRCMQIIDELEPVRRGPYTGSFGYIGYNGNMDMNIIIRTLVRTGGRVYAQAGAGIVADSAPQREYRETLRKAEAMVRAVELVSSDFPSAIPGL